MKIKLMITSFILLFLSAEAQQYGLWEIIDSMDVRRRNFSSSIFANNKILATGGDLFPNYNSAEIYNGEIGLWENTTSMLEGRLVHHLLTLSNGNVIAIGGFLKKSCEVFNPDSNSWRYTDSIETIKYWGSTVTPLDDGRILVVGGYYFNQSTLQNIYYNTCEIYDPATESWSFIDSLSEGRAGHTATILDNGKVLVAGGYGGINYLNSCEIYDPVTNQWSAAGNLLHARDYHSSLPLSDGRVLVSGGTTPDSTLGTRYCEIYDPTANSWSEAGEMTVPRTSHKSVLLFDSTVLITGGSFEPEIWEIYDPKTQTIIFYDTLPHIVFEPELEMFPDGRIVSLGGYTFNGGNVEWSNQCLMYTPRVTSVTEEHSFVTDFSLSQNYPNPFNPTTIINFQITEPDFVTLKVFDVLGKEVATLVNEEKSAGIYEEDFNGAKLSSGIYFYQLHSGNFVETKKMIFLK